MPDDCKIPFGCHQGKKIGDVPANYLLWLIKQDWISIWPDVRNYIFQNQDMLIAEEAGEE